MPSLDAVEILFGAARNAGIVDQHIELAEMSGGGGHDGGPALLLSHIERFKPRPPHPLPPPRAPLPQCVAAPPLAPFAGKLAPGAPPHAVCGAKNVGYFARQSHDCPPLL